MAKETPETDKPETEAPETDKPETETAEADPAAAPPADGGEPQELPAPADVLGVVEPLFVTTDVTRARLRRLHTRFCAALPQAAQGGMVEPDGLSAEGLENGRYRPVGADWVYTVEDGAVVRIERATADNGYGGLGVWQVDIA